ncbi:MAG: NFACT RNA binding domain-containing protein [Nanoarchaeota archaeon]
MEIKLFLDKDINENANFYFEKAKKLKAKLPGLEKATEQTQKEISELEANKEKHMARKEKEEKIKVHKKKEWYEKFRWTFLSSGHLLVMGKDSVTNEILVKKHMEENDIVFHTQAPASPFGIVKDGKEIEKEKEILMEAASMVANFSSQWKKGFGTADAFWVYPEQISKTANSGEFMSKGSFMIRGDKNIIKNLPTLICLGIRKIKIKTDNEEIEIEEGFSGSLPACQKFCGTRFVKLEPGDLNYKKLNKELKTKLKFSFEDLPKLIPNNCKILKR